MRNALSLAVAGALAVGTFAMTGCQSDVDANYDADARTRPSVDLEMGGGMNRTGAGSDTGSSASGFDRAGGGFGGTHGLNSGAIGSEPRPAAAQMTPSDQWTMPGALPPEQGANGPGGAPSPGR
jgi:hypothetical protein